MTGKPAFANPLVTVTIVTFDSRKYIERCLDSIYEQDYRPIEVIVVDNASTDGTAELLMEYEDLVRVLYNYENTGFAAAQNQAIAAGHGEWVLTLNPDVRLFPGFIERLVEAASSGSGVGTVCGKLLRAAPDLSVPRERRIDSTGIHFTPSQRHFDRGWNEPDDGRFNTPEYVFGATAAAALYRREMIEDVSLDGDFFDPDFFTYREDADIAWRAQLMGWRCLYVPSAMGCHVRRISAANRRSAPPVLRMHSVKNRFLMRIKNMTGDLYHRHWKSITMRDVLVTGGCLLAEPACLPAFWRLACLFPRALAKRREIMKRCTVTDEYMAAWFSEAPASKPLHVPATDHAAVHTS
ncbi:MAG TPA: glycosyltransferase [Bryobacteraceae bacterium]|nr:glycosyltransferase [Bryobacteraceae bacterium]